MKTRVLVVDDHPKLIKFLEIDLKIHGYNVYTISSGQGCLNWVRAYEPDIVVLDMRMPEMDGFETLRRLRTFSSIPVVAYSATPEYSSRAMECGANAFIAKPFELEQLQNLIERLTSSQEVL